MWNHRVVHQKDQSGDFYEIAEVFYDIDNIPYAFGQATVCGDKLEFLSEQLSWMMDALSKPVLYYPKDFTGDVNKDEP